MFDFFSVETEERSKAAGVPRKTAIVTHASVSMYATGYAAQVAVAKQF